MSRRKKSIAIVCTVCLTVLWTWQRMELRPTGIVSNKEAVEGKQKLSTIPKVSPDITNADVAIRSGNLGDIESRISVAKASLSGQALRSALVNLVIEAINTLPPLDAARVVDTVDDPRTYSMSIEELARRFDPRDFSTIGKWLLTLREESTVRTALRAIGKGLPSDVAKRVLENPPKELDKDQQNLLQEVAYLNLARTEPKALMELTGNPKDDFILTDALRGEAVSLMIEGANPEAAYKLLNTIADPTVKTNAEFALVSAIGKQSPEKAWKIVLNEADPAIRQQLGRAAITGIAPVDPMSASQYVAELKDPVLQEALAPTLIAGIYEYSPKEAFVWAEFIKDNDAQLKAMQLVLSAYAVQSPTECKEALMKSSLSAENKAALIARFPPLQ